MSVHDWDGRAGAVVIVQLTLRCPLACAHCVVSSGPDNAEEMPDERAAEWIEALARDGRTRVVVFTGGEPFLGLSRLRRLSAAARRGGLQAVAVTSASWAPTYERAARVLDGLPGLAGLEVSADRYHLEFLPLDNVAHALRAALDRGLEAGLFVTLAGAGDDILARLREAVGEDVYARVRVRVVHTHLAGRALEVPEIGRAVERVPFEALPDQACPDAGAPVILADGRVLTCCGDCVAAPARWAALQIGDLAREPVAAALARADADPLVQGLRFLGPKRLAALAARRLGRPLPTRLFERHNICDVCREVATSPAAAAAARAALAERAPELAAARLVLYGEPSAPLDAARS